MENNIYAEFINLGYKVQEPTKDKTYYFVKQNIGETRQIFIKIKGKKKNSAEIEVLSNFKKAELDKKETAALENLMFGELGIVEYEFI